MAPKASSCLDLSNLSSHQRQDGPVLAGCWELSLPCAIPELCLGVIEERRTGMGQNCVGSCASSSGVWQGQASIPHYATVRLALWEKTKPSCSGSLCSGGVEREETGSKGSSGPGMCRITLWKCLAVFSDYRGTRPPRLHPLSA